MVGRDKIPRLEVRMTALLLLISSFVLTNQGAPPRDPAVNQRGASATIRGRVVAADTGQPLHRVRVSLGTPSPNAPFSVTDTRGEFEISGVPAGSYTLTFTRAGYLTIQYGQRAPREAGRTLLVKAGESVAGINIALPRGAVLAGTISDDTGDLYAGVRVEAVEFRFIRGRRVAVQAASTLTDDLGHYRIAGLAPGTYMIRASSTDTWQDDEGRSTFAYSHTYFPGVTGSEQAQHVSLSVGQESANLNFAMRAGRTAVVKGIVRTLNGEPLPSQNVTLERTTRGAGGVLVSRGGPGGATTRAGTDGTFEFANVPPGEYVVGSGGSADRFEENIIVSDGEIKVVDLAARKPSPLSGSIVTRDGSPLPFPAAQLRVAPVPTDPESLFVSFTGPRETTVGRDAAFRFNDVRGQYLFRISGLPDEWALTGVFAGDVNQIDTPIDFVGGDARPLRLVVSKTAAKVDGHAITRDGKATADCTVVIFAEEPGRWTLASRFIRAVRPDDAGNFTVSGLPAGKYRAAAREFVAEGQWEDPEFLTSLLVTAVRFELADGASQTLTVTVEAQR
jgi:hypothetical protein